MWFIVYKITTLVAVLSLCLLWSQIIFLSEDPGAHHDEQFT